MLNNPGMTLRERILGGLWGSLVGDALGVPVEFKDRVTVQSDPVSDMRGYGTHDQPPGTWSDDSSLLLCSADSLLRHEFDTADMGQRFLRWFRQELWTPHGKVFDAGVATVQALTRISTGIQAELAGGDTQFSNGNGSLMRILPVSLRFATASTTSLLDRVHRASAITHRHPRSQMACGLFTLAARRLIGGDEGDVAVSRAQADFRAYYEPDPWWSTQLECFPMLLANDLARRPESEIESGGYVIHTLGASLWCLLNTTSYESCVLKAVNLGGDTDTTGCVAGGLAGMLYGVNAIPLPWRNALARHDDIATLFDQFADLIQRETSNSIPTT